MLARERQNKILDILENKSAITVTEIKDILKTSESTIRRDFTELHNKGKLIKVFGGAISTQENYEAFELSVDEKSEMNIEEKREIAKKAVTFINDNDFVYLDAGTTTNYMIDYIKASNVTFVTNAVTHAQKLSKKGAKVILLGGELKPSTEAIIGSITTQIVQNFNFNKGFFGTNGISIKKGFTTVDINEALIKKISLQQCEKAFVLADNSKFNQVSCIKFAQYYDATIITDKALEKYKNCNNIILVT